MIFQKIPRCWRLGAMLRTMFISNEEKHVHVVGKIVQHLQNFPRCALGGDVKKNVHFHAENYAHGWKKSADFFRATRAWGRC